ncbi:Methylase involved in ubiquinone/menaquinone biosynthesis [Hoeflea phototrophica DFL-43]|jgi:SAM-dependent methyltransferase|uniref:Methylase involved in ubiquinone/menaquinone biosynthesis n=1 Tax=Hoeflea phototrophica (strain DSM 17068 / NCIMB 14078 / DFL-43) TaxID=411684 RepID=A9DFC8_HOEPD|nr:methyltransferase domain-containing protein [Hoeflea phototrophica]EDQ31749.1 Methylase involved in ubiquinone/menaquinone biosynthesis [Hoeflea phototrophica DFL-43]
MTLDTDMTTQANRLAWDASAARHQASPEWARQIQGFKDPAFATFDPVIDQLLRKQGIEGARAVQVGCNNGRETLSMLALGAREAVGIDQSSAFLSLAEQLRTVSPHKNNCRFVNANVYALPEDLSNAFDFALITIGVINWMPDLDGFLASVASLLKPGGRLVMYETHPVLDMFEPHAEDPHRPAYSYFRTEPFITDEEIVYDGSQTAKAPPSYWHFHTMGEIITGCVEAGLQIRQLTEYPHSNREVDYDIYVAREAQLPLCYTLVTEKA